MGRITYWLAVVVAAGAWLHSPSVHAAPHQACLYLNIGDELWDASPRAADGKDFREEHGRNEGPYSYPAQRWLARVRDDGTGEVVWGWGPLDGAGCVAFDLTGPTDLTLEWVRWAMWEDTGNMIGGYRCDAAAADCLFEIQARTLSADTGTGTTSFVVEAPDYEEVDVILWATSFAEERFASLGEQPLTNTTIFVSYDPGGLLPGFTQADWTFGNQPSVIVQGDAWHSKFTIAHEYGHLQTLLAAHPTFGPADLDYCYDEFTYPSTNPGCTPDHTFDSSEWQAAAVIEGIAHWYSVATWNDVDVIDCNACQPSTKYVQPSSATDARDYPVPRGSPRCTDPGRTPCPPGVSNEWDWLSALRLFRINAPVTPSFRTMLRMVSRVYAEGAWFTNSPNDSFWQAFDSVMASYLSPNHAAWQAAAAQMEIDR